MRIGSLFSGAAGLDRAVEAVFGGEVVWFSEIDAAASKVLAYHYPGVPNLGDITAIDWTTVAPVDIVCGGWPCQPFSLAGKRKGIDDDRALWPHVAGAIRRLRPRYVVLENVSAVLTAGEFHRVAADLAACGYDFGWTCARAADVGAPHRRERVFIVAHTTGDGWDQGRPEHAGIVGGSDAAIGGAAHSGYIGHRDRYGAPYPSNADLLPTPVTSDARSAGRHSTGTGIMHPGTSLTDAIRLLPTPRSSDCFGAGLHGDGGMDLRTTIDLMATSTSWGKYRPAIARWEAVLGRPAPDPTEPNRSGNPRLSAAFSEWLMGWPDGWVTDPDIGISRNDQLKIIGNGVVSRCAEAAIRYLLTVAVSA